MCVDVHVLCTWAFKTINFPLAPFQLIEFFSTAPSDGPPSLSPDTMTANTATVHWEEVPCLHRNGEITGYTVETRTSGVTVKTDFVNNGYARAATISGLNSSTPYTVSVAAFNGAGTGPPSAVDITTCKCVVLNSTQT